MTIKNLYPSVRPTLDLNFAQTKQLDPRITFSRSSSGTYFDNTGLLRSAGTNQARFDHDPVTGESLGLLVEEARTNSFMNSINFLEPGPSPDHRWQKDETYIIPNADIAPDGTFTASKVVATTATAVHRIRRVKLVASPSWASIYLKAAEYTICDVYDLNVDTGFRIDLTTGVISESPALGKFRNGRYGVDAVGNGWYRVRVGRSDSDATTGNPLSIYPNGAQSYAGNGSSGVLVWGAQLEAGSSPTSYTPTPTTFTSRSTTATYYDASGTIQTAAIDVARSDAYFPNDNGVMTPAGLLFEVAGTNLATYSEQFDNAAWVKTNATVTANAATAPDGTSTADLLYPNSTGSYRRTYFFASIASAVTTQSVFVKAAGFTRCFLVGTGTAWFNLSNGTVGTVTSGSSATIQKLPNGWYRCSLTQPASDTPQVSVGVCDADNSYDATASGTNGIYIWGAQLEASPYPTSYIPTTSSTVTRAADVSTSATVTRSADVAQITGTNFSSWYNQSEGTVFADAICRGLGSNGTVSFVGQFSNGTESNYIDVLRYQPNTASFILTGGVVQSNLNPGLAKGVFRKSAHAFKTDDVSLSVSGETPLTDNSANLPTVDRINLGNDSTNLRSLNGHVSRLAYYPVRLPDVTLQALTR